MKYIVILLILLFSSNISSTYYCVNLNPNDIKNGYYILDKNHCYQ